MVTDPMFLWRVDAQETWSYGDCVDPRELGAPPVDDLSLAPPSPLAVSPVSVEANETGDFEGAMARILTQSLC